MTDTERLKSDVQAILKLFTENEWLTLKVKSYEEYVKNLEAENRRLKYEYNDSLLKRDEPLPYKWRYDGTWTWQYCPKCDGSLNNWMNYCPNCGQKIKQGNPEKEMEIDGTNNAGEREERQDRSQGDA